MNHVQLEYVRKPFLIIKDLLEENLNVKEKNMLHLKKKVQEKLEKIKNNLNNIIIIHNQ